MELVGELRGLSLDAVGLETTERGTVCAGSMLALHLCTGLQHGHALALGDRDLHAPRHRGRRNDRRRRGTRHSPKPSRAHRGENWGQFFATGPRVES